MKIQTFVFVHDEQIVLDFESNNKFKEFQNLSWVFLGQNPYDRIKHMDNLIVARELEYNIEDHNKQLLAYSGWHALWRNNLIDADFINLFEYDIILRSDFQQIQAEYIKEDTQFIGYVPLEIHNYLFLGKENVGLPLMNSIKKHHGIDCLEYVNGIENEKFVGLTSNQSMSVDTFNKFMEWMAPIENDIKTEYMGGHMPERAFPFYCTYYNLHGYLVSDILHHLMMDTHGTTGFYSEEYFNSNYEKLLKK